MMIVGGIGIDTIELTVRVGQQVRQGDELGCFHMGGSTILLAMPRRQDLLLRGDIAVASACQTESTIRVGEVVAQLQPAKPAKLA